MRDIQFPKQIVPEQSKARTLPRPPGGVGQDKNAPKRDRIAVPQPVTLAMGARSRSRDTKRPQSQKQSTKRKTVPVMLWVKPAIKAELHRVAAAEGLSLSKSGGAFLEEAVRQKLHVQHAVLLQPIIEQAIREQMSAIVTRLTWLLVRIAFDSGQTRSLLTNLLGRQPGVTPALLEQLLDGSSNTAKRNIMRRTPQLATLIEAVERWIAVGEEGAGEAGD